MIKAQPSRIQVRLVKVQQASGLLRTAAVLPRMRRLTRSDWCVHGEDDTVVGHWRGQFHSSTPPLLSLYYLGDPNNVTPFFFANPSLILATISYHNIPNHPR